MSKDGANKAPPGTITGTRVFEDVAPRSQELALWREALAREVEVHPLQEGWHFLTGLENWRVGDIIMSHQHVPPTRYERTQPLIDASRSNWIVVYWVQEGCRALFKDGRQIAECTPEIAVIMDWSLPHTTISTDEDLFVFAIPREQIRVADRMDQQIPLVTLPLTSACGGLLQTAMSTMIDQVRKVTREDAAPLAEGFAGLVNSLLASHDDVVSNSVGKSRTLDVRRFIEKNLREPRLSVKVLCDEFHCSRATIYRMFESEGGVASYIQRERLYACMRELARIQDPPKGIVEQVASAWGFSNPHRFSRLFRSEFNISPQQALKAQAELHAGKSDQPHRDDYASSAALLSKWLTSQSDV